MSNPACTILLPKNLAAIAKTCERAATGNRFTNSGVHLSQHGRDYVAVATDGRTLAMVEGVPESVDDYPEIAALVSAPNTAHEAIIPAKDWTAAFKSVPKRGKPVLQNAAVVMGENVTTWATTDLDTQSVQQPRNLEGRFPDYRRVIPTKNRVASVKVNADNMARILLTAAEYADMGTGVTIELYADGAPIKITSQNTTQRFTGLVVPLTTEKPAAPKERARMVHPHVIDVTRIIARIMTVWHAHAKAYEVCAGSAKGAHRDIMQRCQKAHAALTAKYLG